MSSRTVFIINPTAGAGSAWNRWLRFAQTLPPGKVRLETRITSKAGEATMIARESVKEYGRVIAVGGDGTISEVAQGILCAGNKNCALGVVPLGTGNDLARMLGISNLDDARRALTANQVRVIDIIEVDCHVAGKAVRRYVLLFAGVGIVSEVLRKTTPFIKRVLGEAWAYRAGLLLALSRYTSPRMRITCDGKLSEGVHLFVGVSNGEDAGGGMRIAPGAQMDDGWLDINVVGAVTRWEALKQLRRLNHGEHTTHPAVNYFRAKEVSVESTPAIEIAADGELIGQTPARLAVRSKALSVLIAC